MSSNFPKKAITHKHFEKYKHKWFIYKEDRIIYASKSSIVGIPSKFRIAVIKSIFELTDM